MTDNQFSKFIEMNYLIPQILFFKLICRVDQNFKNMIIKEQVQIFRKQVKDCIRIFKIYGWEEKLAERIYEAREIELGKQKTIFQINKYNKS